MTTKKKGKNYYLPAAVFSIMFISSCACEQCNERFKQWEQFSSLQEGRTADKLTNAASSGIVIGWYYIIRLQLDLINTPNYRAFTTQWYCPIRR